MNSECDRVAFDPWVGDRYGCGRFGLRLLVLGESHYSREVDPVRRQADQDSRDMTISVIRWWGIENASHDRYYFKRTARLLCADRYAGPKRCADVWQDVAFYNLVQRLADGSRRPKWNDFKAGRTPFLTVMNALEPDAVIVTGKTAWDWIEDLTGQFNANFEWVYHPAQASGRFQYNEAIPILEGLLAKARKRLGSCSQECPIA